MPTDPAAAEIAARVEREMPWTIARPESWWEVTGRFNERHTFTTCLARVLPRSMHGGNITLFEVLVYGDPFVVPASSITRARELLLVDANDPTEAYFERDQPIIDRAIREACGV